MTVGEYRLEFDQGGFKTSIRRGITLLVNQVVILNTVMQLGAAHEVVEVTSEAPLVDTTSTQLGAVVNERSLTQLPLNSRDTLSVSATATRRGVAASGTLLGIDEKESQVGNLVRRYGYDLVLPTPAATR